MAVSSRYTAFALQESGCCIDDPRKATVQSSRAPFVGFGILPHAKKMVCSFLHLAVRISDSTPPPSPLMSTSIQAVSRHSTLVKSSVSVGRLILALSEREIQVQVRVWKPIPIKLPAKFSHVIWQQRRSQQSMLSCQNTPTHSLIPLPYASSPINNLSFIVGHRNTHAHHAHKRVLSPTVFLQHISFFHHTALCQWRSRLLDDRQTNLYSEVT